MLHEANSEESAGWHREGADRIDRPNTGQAMKILHANDIYASVLDLTGDFHIKRANIRVVQGDSTPLPLSSR